MIEIAIIINNIIVGTDEIGGYLRTTLQKLLDHIINLTWVISVALTFSQMKMLHDEKHNTAFYTWHHLIYVL